MKQLNITILLTVLLSMVGIQAFADFDKSKKVQVGELYYYLDESKKQAQVTSMPSGIYSGEVTIPSSFEFDSQPYDVTSIGNSAFYYCSGLTSVTIGNNVEWIEARAFQFCSGLTSVIFGNSVKAIGSQAFSNCSGLTSITIPNSVTHLWEEAFSGCFGLTSIVIPNSVTSIDKGAFSGCSGLTSITIPNSVTSIEDFAFSGCSGITSISIPNWVTSIGSGAFQNCTGLSSVTISESVTNISGNPFIGCYNLTSIRVEDGNNVYDSRDNCNAIIHTNTNALKTGCNATVIPNSVKSIDKSAFSGCSKLISVTIPSSVTTIGSYAFDNCSELTTVNIPEGITIINHGTFINCSKLISITIPNGVTSISDYAFSGCSELTSVIIPNNVKSIGNYAFDRCTGITSVTLPSSVTSIVSYAFNECQNLTTVTIESNDVLSKDYSLGKSLKSIFGNQVKTYIIGNMVNKIGALAFYDCSELTSIIIPESVTIIGHDAFEWCSSLSSIILPKSITNIGSSVFSYCSNLYDVYNEATTPQKLSSNPYFNYTTATLHVPAGTKELYQAADYWKNFSNIVEDINTVIVEDDKEPATIVEGEEFYNLVLDKETVEFAEIISANEAGKGRIAIKDGGLLIVKGDDVRFALSEIKKGDILVFDFIGKIRCLYGTLTANAAQQNSFPQVTGDEMELESGKEYIANEDCDVVLEMETTEAPVELKGITITEPTGVSIVENSTSNSLSGKAYNLAGQQVNADSKGLTIPAGKKIIKH